MILKEEKRVNQKIARDFIKKLSKDFYFYRVEFGINFSSDSKLIFSPDKADKAFLRYWEIDDEQRKRYIEEIMKVIDAINVLRLTERKILIKRFLFGNGVYDYEIAEEMKLTLRTYERYKASAIHNLAIGLGVTEGY